MGENWVDADRLLDNSIDMDEELKGLYEYDKLMKEKPVRRKNNYDCSQKVYEKDGFIILKVHTGKKIGYIVYNTKKEWEGGHTHLKSFEMAKTIISNVRHEKKPNTNNVYLMRSHARLSNNEHYIKYIEELIQTKKSKNKQDYYNARK